MLTNTILPVSAILVGLATAMVPAPVLAAGASSDYGKTYCSYLKTRAMAATDANRRKALMAEYRRCLKEHGEG